MQPNPLTRWEFKGKIYVKNIGKIHVGSETNWKVGSRFGSEKNHSGSTTLIAMLICWPFTPLEIHKILWTNDIFLYAKLAYKNKRSRIYINASLFHSLITSTNVTTGHSNPLSFASNRCRPRQAELQKRPKKHTDCLAWDLEWNHLQQN